MLIVLYVMCSGEEFVDFICPNCGSDKLDILVCEGEDETLLCTDCGFDEFDLSQVSPAK
jgi:predicted RNA-binding Zn-ribbon protein involved in translation (DUF1610 family)